MTGINRELNWGHARVLRVLPVNWLAFLFVTLDFDDWDHFEMHRYAFHVNDAEFDAIFGRIKEAGIPYDHVWHRQSFVMRRATWPKSQLRCPA
jgi:hypothetical protein